MSVHSPLLVLFVAWSSLLWAQDQDLVVKGVLTDAATGKPLAGFADVFDEMDTTMSFSTACGLDGTFDLALYSYDSSYYVLSFEADGHVTRRAVLDMTTMDADLDDDMAWEIRMDVALERSSDSVEDPGADDLLGSAVFDNKLRTIRWSTSAARTRFPVKRMQLRRLESAENTIDSLSREEGTLVAGIVMDQWTERPIAGAIVVVTDTAWSEEHIITDEFGVYGITLPYDRVYRLRYGKAGMVDKVVELDNRNIPDSERVRGFRLQVDMRLFNVLKGEDLSFLDGPIGKARYDSTTNNLKWDMDHTRALQERLQQVLDRHPKGR